MRIQEKVPREVGQLYSILEEHGVETFAPTKLRGAAQLISNHLGDFHRINNDESNFNTLGPSLHTIPQYNREGAIKGATFTFISNGGAVSTLEFLPNAQAASNTLQRLLGGKPRALRNIVRQMH